MSKKLKIALSLVLTTLLFSTHVNAEKAPDAVNKIIPTVTAWGSEQEIIDATKAQNAKGMSLDDIKARDKEWRAVDGLDNEMKAMLSSPAANKLLELEKTAPYFFEVFLMDNQGANIAMTNKTSDYWQGDEAKWQESFKGGKGAVHIGDVEFDESAQAYLVQLSVPVMDGGVAIGAITIGVNLDELEAQ